MRRTVCHHSRASRWQQSTIQQERQKQRNRPCFRRHTERSLPPDYAMRRTQKGILLRHTGLAKTRVPKTAGTHKRKSKRNRRRGRTLHPEFNPSTARQNGGGKRCTIHLRKDRHLHQPRADRRDSRHQPNAMVEFQESPFRETGLGRNRLVGGRHQTKHLPMAWRRLEDTPQHKRRKRTATLPYSSRAIGHQLSQPSSHHRLQQRLLSPCCQTARRHRAGCRHQTEGHLCRHKTDSKEKRQERLRQSKTLQEGR